MEAKELLALVEQVISKKNAYSYVTFRQHKNTERIHLFPSRTDNGKCTFYRESYCSRRITNAVKLKDTEKLPSVRLKVLSSGKIKEINVTSDKFLCVEREKARLLAALLQNNGYDVCGVCVSHLYHLDGEE
ncbi:hypothetical protein [Desulfurobacterium sp. TC5-1]|uniref:hypothetical protein n=1 Tax=Desulfurobacterium sp. TC5-1 TaxID=1158318 RepID=UPI0003B35E8D|nr:hypothetical protein [Desulfurobacterium sp. TC5-1]